MRTPALLLLLAATPAVSHPLGRDEYSLRAGIEASDEGVRVVVMGEIPIADVITGLGKLAGGKPPTKAHQAQWTEARLDELAKGQTVTVDGAELKLEWEPSRSALNGRAVDGFFVYVVQAAVPAPLLDDDITLVLNDQAWTAKPMVYSADVRAKGPWKLKESSAPSDWTSDSATRRLTVRFVKGEVE